MSRLEHDGHLRKTVTFNNEYESLSVEEFNQTRRRELEDMISSAALEPLTINFTDPMRDTIFTSFGFHNKSALTASTASTASSSVASKGGNGNGEKQLQDPVVMPLQVKQGVTAEELSRILETIDGVNVEEYGVGHAKSIEQLADEIGCGDSSILYFPDSGTLVRLVQPVFVKLRLPSGHVLVNTSDLSLHTNKIKHRHSLLAEKMQQNTDRSATEAALRGIEEELGISRASLLHLIRADEVRTSVNMCMKGSPSYPGLNSLYQQHLIELDLHLDSLDEELLASSEVRFEEVGKKLGLVLEREDGCAAAGLVNLKRLAEEEFTSMERKKTGVVVHHWVWMSEQLAYQSRVVGLCGL